MSRGDLTREQWERLRPLLPCQNHDGSSLAGSSPDRQWPGLAAAQKSALAGPSRSVWSLADDCHALLSLATRRHLGAHPGGFSAARRRRQSALAGDTAGLADQVGQAPGRRGGATLSTSSLARHGTLWTRARNASEVDRTRKGIQWIRRHSSFWVWSGSCDRLARRLRQHGDPRAPAVGTGSEVL